eukprot:g5777.t1
MSAFFNSNASPSKKAKPTGDEDDDGYRRVGGGEVIEGRTCPDEECPHPKELLIKYRNGRPFVVCSNNVKDDPSSCQFTANKFGADRVKGPDSKIACKCCSVPVEHVLSIGRPNGKKDTVTGKPLYDNIHLFPEECIAKRAKDPTSGKTVLVHVTAAAGEIVGAKCAAYDPNNVADDLVDGCTGDIKPGDAVIRSWSLQDPPKGLHARCAKRKHTAFVQEILADKKYRKQTGTSAEDEAKAPSLEITADLEDF